MALKVKAVERLLKFTKNENDPHHDHELYGLRPVLKQKSRL